MRDLEEASSALLAYSGPTDKNSVPAFAAPVEADLHYVFPAHYLSVMWRQGWKILLFVGAVTLAAFVVSSRLAPIYEATAKINVDRAVLTATAGQESAANATTADANTSMATQMEILQSDAVLRPVALRYHLLEKENQIGKNAAQDRRVEDAPIILKCLKISRPAGTYLLYVSYRSTDPQLAAEVSNAIAQSYIERISEVRSKSSAIPSSSAQTQLEDLKARLERSGTALTNFEQQSKVVNSDDKTNILSARLLRLSARYAKAQSDRVSKEAVLKASTNAGSVAKTATTEQRQDLSQFQERIDTAKQHLADVVTVYGPDHAEYRKAKGELDEVNRQFEQARDNASHRFEAEYKEAVDREDFLRRAVQYVKAEYDRLNSKSSEYQQLKRAADEDKTLFADLEHRVLGTAITPGVLNPYIRIADSARPPNEPVFPNKRLNLLFALLASGILGICVAIVADVMDHTIHDPQQAARQFHTTLLGSLPDFNGLHCRPGAAVTSSRYVQKGGKKSFLCLTVPEPYVISPYEEAIRTLLHSILLPDADRSLRSLLVTSALPQEGRSTAVLHLAIAHAEQGKRTLLIDADLRHPCIHKKLGIRTLLGLSNVLLREFRWPELVLKTNQSPNLEVLPAGEVSRRPSDLVGSLMIDILRDASKVYDLVLVDAPAILGFAESMQLSKAVDGVLVIARGGKTSQHAVADAFAMLKRLGANVIGLVLNGT